MRTFSILVGSAMCVAAFGSAVMAEELKDCGGQYDSKAGTTFGRCAGSTLETFQGPGGIGVGSGTSGASSGGSSGGSATGGNR